MSLAESAVGEGADGAAQAEPALAEGREISGSDLIVCHYVRQHQVKAYMTQPGRPIIVTVRGFGPSFTS